MQTPDVMTAVALAIQYPEEEIVITDNSPSDVDHALQNAGYEIVDAKSYGDYSFMVYSNVKNELTMIWNGWTWYVALRGGRVYE